MPRSARPSTPIFATAPYSPDSEGILRVVLPARCPFAAADADGANCRLAVRHIRHRKTGPCFPIAVVRCGGHPDHSFTLYPPGHFPYGRVAVVRCSVSGPPLLDRTTKRPCWEGTLLEAASDAASDRRWSPHSAKSEPAVRRTQERRIDVAGLLLGVHPELDDGERERIATRLRVPTMTIRTAASTWSDSWTTRGAAVALVLAAVPVDGALLDRLLSAGYAAGLWAQPRRWEPPRHWEIARSDESEHPTAISSKSRAPPATTSRVAPAVGPAASSSP